MRQFGKSEQWLATDNTEELLRNFLAVIMEWHCSYFIFFKSPYIWKYIHKHLQIKSYDYLL